jgi:hypothetical protein
MQYLNQPYFKREGNIWILYKLNFSTGDSNFSEHTSVADGNSIEVERFSSEEELQQKSLELFKQKAREIKN